MRAQHLIFFRLQTGVEVESVNPWYVSWCCCVVTGLAWSFSPRIWRLIGPAGCHDVRSRCDTVLVEQQGLLEMYELVIILC